MKTSLSTYGERNVSAASELDTFAFLVGKWQGSGTAKTEDGGEARFELTWIGRYVLDGNAIADEFHGATPDGKPYLGISLRHFDAQQGSWIVEYLNVTGSFLRRQVNPRSGSVSREGDTVVVVAEDGQSRIRERYRVIAPERFSYSTDLSRDSGVTWDPPAFEMMLTRVESAEVRTDGR